jgi:hypothetical protein
MRTYSLSSDDWMDVVVVAVIVELWLSSECSDCRLRIMLAVDMSGLPIIGVTKPSDSSFCVFVVSSCRPIIAVSRPFNGEVCWLFVGGAVSRLFNGVMSCLCVSGNFCLVSPGGREAFLFMGCIWRGSANRVFCLRGTVKLRLTFAFSFLGFFRRITGTLQPYKIQIRSPSFALPGARPSSHVSSSLPGIPSEMNRRRFQTTL